MLRIQGEASAPEGWAGVQTLQVCDVVFPGTLLKRPAGNTTRGLSDAAFIIVKIPNKCYTVLLHILGMKAQLV